jgi:hypothetical protein
MRSRGEVFVGFIEPSPDSSDASPSLSDRKAMDELLAVAEGAAR